MRKETFAVITGGGTAGHVTPALAIGRALVEHGRSPSAILYVGSRRGLEARLVPEAGFEVSLLPGRGLTRRLELRNVVAVLGLAVAMVGAVVLLARRRPTVVVSVGGYAGFACAAAAVVLRIPLVLANADAVPGAANRLLGRFAKASAVAFEGTPLPRAVVTGTPVRKEFASADASSEGKREARARLGLPEDDFVVAAFGGSLGSRRLNEAVIGMVGAWSGSRRMAIYHVLGRRDWSELSAVIPRPTSEAVLYRAVEYEERMADLLVAADVVACRAGATSVAELSVVGRPAVLVPFPRAPRDHQTANAMVLVRAGAAVCVSDPELTSSRLGEIMGELMRDPQRLASMERAARTVGHPDAADAVASLVEECARPTPRGSGPRASERDQFSDGGEGVLVRGQP